VSAEDGLAWLQLTVTTDGRFADLKAVCSACGADFDTNITLSDKPLDIETLQREMDDLHDLWTVHVFTVHPDEWFLSTSRTNKVVPQSE
jgi:hypothetical protein